MRYLYLGIAIFWAALLVALFAGALGLLGLVLVAKLIAAALRAW